MTLYIRVYSFFSLSVRARSFHIIQIRTLFLSKTISNSITTKSSTLVSHFFTRGYHCRALVALWTTSIHNPNVRARQRRPTAKASDPYPRLTSTRLRSTQASRRLHHQPQPLQRTGNTTSTSGKLTASQISKQQQTWPPTSRFSTCSLRFPVKTRVSPNSSTSKLRPSSANSSAIQPTDRATHQQRATCSLSGHSRRR